jgi:hypothetical protein
MYKINILRLTITNYLLELLLEEDEDDLEKEPELLLDEEDGV